MNGGSEAAPRLRPLAIGEILDGAIKVCIAHAGTLMKAVLVVVLPVQVVSALVLASTIEDPDYLNPTTSDPGTPTGGDEVAAFLGGQVAIALLGGVAFLLATGACFRAIAEGWLGRRPQWRESLGFAARRTHSLLWIGLLYGLGVAAGSVLLILPGIWIAVAWIVAFPVLLVEDRRGTKALGRSFRLVEGRWWPAAGVLIVGFLLATVLGIVFQLAVGLLAAVNDSLGFLIVVSSIATLITQLITTPFQAAIVALLYFDLRVRKEGFDLELLAARLAGGDPLGPGSPAVAGAWSDETDAELRAQAPYWPPPPGWKPPPAASPSPAGASPSPASPSADASRSPAAQPSESSGEPSSGPAAQPAEPSAPPAEPSAPSSGDGAWSERWLPPRADDDR